MQSNPRTAEKNPAADLSADDARARLRDRIQFAESAHWVQQTPMAAAFRDALCDTLVREDVDRIRVRCGVTREDQGDLRFMCKVEYAGGGRDGATYPWSWWSPLMEKPEELVQELRRALRARRERLAGRPSAGSPTGSADKARGPAHDTWSTMPWDLGHGVRPDSFCRNRRGRWTGHSSSPRPFRPRSPR
jgi:hypothetical protein